MTEPGAQLMVPAGLFTRPTLRSHDCRPASRYGDEINNPKTADEREKFATYTRDAYTGLDYADQRYYASTYGRFNTADPYQASGGPGDPSSWNRYSYVQGDPVNHRDTHGLMMDELVDDGGGGGDWDYFGGGDPFDASTGGGPGLPCGFGYGTVCGFGPGPVIVAPPPPPEPDEPTCSISLYERPVYQKILGVTVEVADHLYIYSNVDQGGGLTSNILCEGGPDAGHNLNGDCSGATNAPVTNGTSGTTLPGNVQVGHNYTAGDVCGDVTKLLASVGAYKDGNKHVPYDPFTLQGYNSNSYAFTLLQGIGLAGTVNGNPYSWFGTPSNTPGWGLRVPGL